MKNNIENNKLIAEFMGMKSHFKKGGLTKVYLNGENVGIEQDWECYYPKLNKSITPIEMKYHNSWDWLMPVVEKIETLFNDGIDVDIFSDGTVITQHRFEENEYLTEGEEIVRLTKAEIEFDTKIEHTYQAVVEFIKWYNPVKENTTDRPSNRDLGQSTII